MGGCYGASADDGLSFVLEVVGGFLFGADVGVGEDVVENCGLAGGFFAAGDGFFYFDYLFSEALDWLLVRGVVDRAGYHYLPFES